MFHYSRATKNKHQNNHETNSELYLYKKHRSPKNLPSHLSVEMKAELDDDIFSMRRRFKRTVKELKHGLYYESWLENTTEKNAIDQYAKLHPQHI